MNLALFNKVQSHIEENPRQWNQTLFGVGETTECGTVACFAGWAVLFGDPSTRVDKEGTFYRRIDGAAVEFMPEAEAPELLGISTDQAYKLFYNFTRDPSVLRSIWEPWTEDVDSLGQPV